MTGRVHSIQTLGALDGPGIRFVVFFQGCNLRCGCCHNPDTWDINGGSVYSAEEIISKAVRYKEYFGQEGGITLSGGEPLLQAEFAKEIFELAHKEDINTCLDTSGSILNDEVKALIDVTDRVLLDIKYTENGLYLKYVGCDIGKPLGFLEYLNSKGVKTTVRQVIIPEINGGEDNIKRLNDIVKAFDCVDKTELLPFKKMCEIKYKKMGLDFPFAHFKEPDGETMKILERLLVL